MRVAVQRPFPAGQVGAAGGRGGRVRQSGLAGHDGWAGQAGGAGKGGQGGRAGWEARWAGRDGGWALRAGWAWRADYLNFNPLILKSRVVFINKNHWELEQRP